MHYTCSPISRLPPPPFRTPPSSPLRVQTSSKLRSSTLNIFTSVPPPRAVHVPGHTRPLVVSLRGRDLTHSWDPLVSGPPSSSPLALLYSHPPRPSALLTTPADLCPKTLLVTQHGTLGSRHESRRVSLVLFLFCVRDGDLRVSPHRFYFHYDTLFSRTVFVPGPGD